MEQENPKKNKISEREKKSKSSNFVIFLFLILFSELGYLSHATDDSEGVFYLAFRPDDDANGLATHNSKFNY